MKKITAESLFDINFLSDINFSKDGNHGAFVVSKGNISENDYNSNIYLYSIETGNIKKLTSFNSEKNITWLDSENIIFPGARNKKDKEEAKKGIPCTVYNKINIYGGEAEKYFSVPAKCSSIKPIDESNFMVLAAFDHNLPNLSELTEEEKEKAVKKAAEENKAYKIFDEIPFWSNGKGVINKKRSRLYIYNKEDNSLKEISPPFMNVSDFSYDKNTGNILYSGAEYQDMMEQKTSVRLYNVSKKTDTRLVLDEDYVVHSGHIIDGSIIFFGIPSKEKDPSINSRYYKVSLKGGTPELFNTGDFSIGAGIGSDCRYGSGASIRLHEGNLYYLSPRGYNSYLFKLDSEGNETQVSSDINGSLDCFDIYGNKVIFIGTRNKGLQEIYTMDLITGNETQVSNFNKKWLETHAVSYPEHFLLKNSDGIDLDGFVIKPVNYDENKKYPAILDIHGGPKSIYGDVLFHEMQLWASEGYFVFFTNPRGSDGKGSEFAKIEGERYLNWDYKDLMEFTDKVLELYPQIDTENIGVTGGSYGGLMTNWIVGHTDRFKAAATQRSISNFISKCLTTDIGYYHNLAQMGGYSPWNGMDVMWDKSPLKYADKCKTPLLFIHSDEDYRCYMADAFQLFTALKMFGVPTRLCLFHGENHELSRNGKPKNRLKRLEEITSWMNKYLK